MEGNLATPAGFTKVAPYGPFHDLVGPMYTADREGKIVMGFRVEEKHHNKGAAVHGGMFLMPADTAMTHAGVQVRPPGTSIVTTALSSEFMAPARKGDWVEAEVDVLRAGRSVVFLACLIRRDGPEGPLLMRASATFQVVGKRTG